MAKPEATGSIAIAPGSDLRFEGEVRFDTVDDGLKGQEYPRVSVSCYQEGVKVWGSASDPEDTVVLGAGANLWQENGGGPASCTAGLYAFGGKENGHEVITLLDEIAFHAEG